MTFDPTKHTQANFAVRCSRLDACGWGMRPSLESIPLAKAYITPGTERFAQGCACCGAPMVAVTVREFLDRLPARDYNPQEN